MTGPPAMTHPMIERAARALVVHNYPGADEADIEEMWEGWVGEVRTVIQALRNPTEDMIQAGLGYLDEHELLMGNGRLAQTWGRMLDRTLTETHSGEGL